MPKILIATAALVFTSIVSEAKSTSKNRPDYTIRKDSSSTQLSIDTNKKVVVFPNPFNVFIYTEEKR